MTRSPGGNPDPAPNLAVEPGADAREEASFGANGKWKKSNTRPPARLSSISTELHKKCNHFSVSQKGNRNVETCCNSGTLRGPRLETGAFEEAGALSVEIDRAKLQPATPASKLALKLLNEEQQKATRTISEF